MKEGMLRRIYARVKRGLPVLGKPADTARRHLRRDGSLDLDALIRQYTFLSGATGFVTGLPGFLMLPLVLPVNLVSNAALQLHMAAAIAFAGGSDLDDPSVEQACIECLLDQVAGHGQNDEETEITKRTGLKLGERLVRFGMRRGTKHLANRAGRRIGFRRMPLFGGIMGAGSDATLTHHVGQCARHRFM